mgnify:CR=1 FL=1
MEITLDLKAIGRHIQEARERQNLTQEEVVLRLGISDSYVSRLERGKDKMSMYRFFTLATVLKASPSELLAGCCPELNAACAKPNAHPEREHIYELANRASTPMLKTMCAICDALVNTADGLK